MSTHVIYVYAVARFIDLMTLDEVTPEGDSAFGLESVEGIHALYSAVPAADFSQEAIDARADDLDWIGAVATRHQAVLSRVMESGTVLPMRAFTLFSSPQSLREFLAKEKPRLEKALERLEGKEEWTIRLHPEGEKWKEAVISRSEALSELASEARSAPSGKGYLLGKKLDDATKKEARAAEEAMVTELAEEVAEKLECDVKVESREMRRGADPQFHCLVSVSRRDAVDSLAMRLQEHCAAQGVTLEVTGPWPPYNFVGDTDGRL